MCRFLVMRISSEGVLHELEGLVQIAPPRRELSQLKKSAVLQGGIPGRFIKAVIGLVELFQMSQADAQVIIGLAVARVGVVARLGFYGVPQERFGFCKLSAAQQQ